MTVEPAEDHAGGNEAAPGGLSVVCHLDDIGKQSVDGSLHQGAGIMAAQLGIDFLNV